MLRAMLAFASFHPQHVLQCAKALGRQLQAKVLVHWQYLSETPQGDAALQQLEALITKLEALLLPISKRGFEAASESLYPANALGAPSGEQIEMGQRFLTYLNLLPPESRRLLMVLYAAIEFGVPLLGFRCAPLSQLAPPQRLAIFERLKGSKIFLLRMLAEAVKSSSTMLYLSHPDTAHYIGETKACGDESKHHRTVKPSAFEGLLPSTTRPSGGQP